MYSDRESKRRLQKTQLAIIDIYGNGGFTFEMLEKDVSQSIIDIVDGEIQEYFKKKRHFLGI
jgi:ArsR family metal-binding transcriptional regulator